MKSSFGEEMGHFFLYFKPFSVQFLAGSRKEECLFCLRLGFLLRVCMVSCLYKGNTKRGWEGKIR
jgi:hypothetical protein